MKKLVKVGLISFLSMLGWVFVSAQEEKTGRAVASGACNVAHSGNFDTIYIRNCGIGERQAAQIVHLLQNLMGMTDRLDAIQKAQDSLKVSPEEDAYLRVTGSLRQVSARLLQNAQFTVVNGSEQSITIDELGCFMNSILMNNGRTFQDVYMTSRKARGLLLERGGDHASFNCPADNGLMSSGVQDEVDCGDIMWTLTYHLGKDASHPTTKYFHYQLLPRENDWTPTGIHEEPLSCSDATAPSLRR